MSPVVLVALVCVAGGGGAALRFVLDGIIRGRVATAYPVGTTVVNLTGSLLLGLVTGLTAAHVLPQPVQVVVGTGFLGGYTTFSTASFETVRLVEDRRHAAAALNAFGLLVAGTLLAAGGYVAGLAIGS